MRILCVLSLLLGLAAPVAAAEDLSGKAVVMVVTAGRSDTAAAKLEAELKAVRGTLGLGRSDFPLVFMDLANPGTRGYLTKLGIQKEHLPLVGVVRWSTPASGGPAKIIDQPARRIDPEHPEAALNDVAITWLKASNRSALIPMLPHAGLLSDSHPAVEVFLEDLQFSATGAPKHMLIANVAVGNADKEPAEAVRVSLLYKPAGTRDWLVLGRQVHPEIPAGFSVSTNFEMDSREVTALLDKAGKPRATQVRAVVRQGGKERALEGTFTPPSRWELSEPELPPPPQSSGNTLLNSTDGTELVLIEGGTFTMGATDAGQEAAPPHQVKVAPFYLGVREVTNSQFEKFVKATGHDAGARWKEQAQKWGPDAPVVCVTQADAAAYCKWAGLRLPTEQEWELAATGTKGRRFPWGDQWSEKGLVFNVMRPAAVGSRPEGKSPQGLLDLAGNVWEWTASELARYPGGKDPRPIYKRDNVVVRGGSYANTDQTSFRCARRYYRDRYGQFTDVGFRCARDR